MPQCLEYTVHSRPLLMPPRIAFCANSCRNWETY